ncbi:hypothetical protein HNY73_001614 [Argiope bruennichi]|uniref:Uncharacterized protein n=1 Tax=Argiope bruennichi TaxID=94029 RepID=A0A8T0FRW2_ARGBR|nr:hypothetical protein HNY73_001614 [Argiope bruennichi]
MEYTGHLIGSSGPVLWSPRSPDPPPMNFFLWDSLKELVYRDMVTIQTDFTAHLHVLRWTPRCCEHPLRGVLTHVRLDTL